MSAVAVVRNGNDYRMYGFVAEEVNKVLPDLATKDEKGNLIGVAYDRVCALLVKQNQLLEKRVAKLEKKLNVLK